MGRLAVEKGMTEEPFGTDEALVEGLKAGEQLAQLILVKRYGPRVKYLIKSIAWDLAEEDAKEVASDVFRRVIRGVRGFDPARGTKFSTPGRGHDSARSSTQSTYSRRSENSHAPSVFTNLSL